MAGLVAAMILTGCVHFACPAIGWMNTLTIELDGDAAAVDRVQLCTDVASSPSVSDALSRRRAETGHLARCRRPARRGAQRRDRHRVVRFLTRIEALVS